RGAAQTRKWLSKNSSYWVWEKFQWPCNLKQKRERYRVKINSGSPVRTFLKRFVDRTSLAKRISEPTVPQPITAQQVLASEHEEGLLLLHVPSGRIFACNRIGARLWRAATDGITLNAISEEIGRDHGVQSEVVQRQARSFLSDLEANGLLPDLQGGNRG